MTDLLSKEQAGYKDISPDADPLVICQYCVSFLGLERLKIFNRALCYKVKGTVSEYGKCNLFKSVFPADRIPVIKKP